MKAVLCPVCQGRGLWEEGKCHGCDGKGWVEVTDVNISSPYYPLPLPYYPIYPAPYYPTWYITTSSHYI